MSDDGHGTHLRPVHPPDRPRRDVQEDAARARGAQAPRRHRRRQRGAPARARSGWAARSASYRALPDRPLPKAGGVNATVVVTIDLDTLSGGSSRPGSSTPANASHPARHAGWPARPASSPSSSAASPRSSTSAAPAGSSPKPSALALATPRRRLHRRRLRLATRDVPRPPRHPLEPRRQHRPRQRRTPLPEAPRHVPPADIGRQRQRRRTRFSRPDARSCR